jgi:hypothetical protein
MLGGLEMGPKMSYSKKTKKTIRRIYKQFQENFSDMKDFPYFLGGALTYYTKEKNFPGHIALRLVLFAFKQFTTKEVK